MAHCLSLTLITVYISLLPGVNFSAGVPLKKRISSFDYVGAVLSIGAMATILMAINFGGSQYAWDSGRTIALFVVSGVLFIAFGVQQIFCILTSDTTRMFPVHFFRNKEAMLLHVLAAACNASLFIPIYYIPIYFQFTRGDTALDSAVRLLPLITILVAFILTNGFLMSKLGFYWPWYLAGAMLALVANVLFCKSPEHALDARLIRLFPYFLTYSSSNYGYVFQSSHLRSRSSPRRWNRIFCSGRLCRHPSSCRSFRHQLCHQLYDDW